LHGIFLKFSSEFQNRFKIIKRTGKKEGYKERSEEKIEK
jgi:hypothetical protein